MKRLLKIAGIVLTVVLLASLFAFAVPVSAATLTWSGVGTPLLATNQLVTAVRDVGPVALSPNFANDNTIFAAVNDVTTPAAPVLFRSLDGGYTWSPTATALGGGLAGAIIVDIEVSANYATDSTVFVATADSTAPGASNSFVYRSTTGGATFGQLGVVTTAANEVITSMSVTPNYDGVGEIAVGIANITAGGVAPANTNVQIWGAGGVLSWSILTGTGNVDAVARDVAAIQYSPNYPIDATLLVVATATAAQPILIDCVGGVWNTIAAAGVNVGAAAVTDYDAAQVAIGTNLLAADIALPSDYLGTTGTLRRAYVSIADEAALAAGVTAATGSNVYRITNVTAGVALYAAGVANLISNLDYAGTYSDGTLFGGRFATWLTAATRTADVYYSTTAPTATGASSPFFGATNPPTGIVTIGLVPAVGAPVGLNMASSTFVDATADFATSQTVIAGTPGDDSAVAVSKDAGVNYNERGLIDNNGVAITFVAGSTIEASPDFANDQTMFMTSTNLSLAATTTNLWRTQDAGAHWDRVLTDNFAAGAFAVAGVGVVAISQEYATNGTVYLGDTTTVNILYSNNHGDGWSPRTINAAIGVTVADIVATDAGTVYVANNGGGQVARSLNSGWVWSGANSVPTGSTGVLTSIAVDGTTVVAGDSLSTVWRSADGGATFARVGVAILAAANNTLVDVRGDQIYAQIVGTGNVYRWDFGTSIAWYLMTPGIVALAPALAAGAGVVISADNTLYAVDPTVVGAGNTSVIRTIEPLFGPAAPAPFWQYVPGLGAIAVVDIAVASGGSNTIIAMDSTAGALWTYTDILSAGSTPPVLTGPANGAALTNTDQASYSVENVAGVTNWNLAFSNSSGAAFFTTTTDLTQNQVPPAQSVFVDISATLAGISNEMPVYWMSRATAPLRGPWSEQRSVNPEPQIGVNAPALNAVQTNLEGRASVTPVLSWAAFKNATGYQIQVAAANSPVNFTEANLVIDEVIGPVTTYAITDALDYNQAYGWRVRALTAAGSSDWSAAVGFLTEKEPAPTSTTQPTYTITVPTSTVTPTFTVTVPPSTTTPTTITPGWIYAIIVVGAVLVIAVVVLIVRTRRIS